MPNRRADMAGPGSVDIRPVRTGPPPSASLMAWADSAELLRRAASEPFQEGARGLQEPGAGLDDEAAYAVLTFRESRQPVGVVHSLAALSPLASRV